MEVVACRDSKLMCPPRADALCHAAYVQGSEERTNSRNGYETRRWDTTAKLAGRLRVLNA